MRLFSNLPWWGHNDDAPVAVVQCEHAHATIRGTDMLGHAYCPDCGEQVPVYEVLRDLLRRLQDQRDQRAA